MRRDRSLDLGWRRGRILLAGIQGIALEQGLVPEGLRIEGIFQEVLPGPVLGRVGALVEIQGLLGFLGERFLGLRLDRVEGRETFQPR